MSYNELYAKSFKYRIMFGKDIKPGDHVSVSVINVDDTLLAVRKAYIDMSPRTLKSNDSENKQSLNSQMKETLFIRLAEEIVNYMKNGVDDFEEWHRILCNSFIEDFAKILKNADKKPKDATYGKAQKIINMTFKYLYCFDDANKYNERFKPCHMALDSYILNWVNSWFIEKYNQGKSKKEKLSKSGVRQLPKWSSLNYNAENDGVPQYIEIQNAIKKQVEIYYNKPPIEVEFEIWYNERKKVKEKEKKV